MSLGNYDVSRRVVTLNGGLIRELPKNPLNSGLGIILICPEYLVKLVRDRKHDKKKKTNGGGEK